MFKPPKMQVVFFFMCLALRALAAPDTCNQCYECTLKEDVEDDAETALDYALGSIVGMDDPLKDYIMAYTTEGLNAMNAPCSAEIMPMNAEDDWPCMAIEITVFDSANENNRKMIGNCRILTSGYDLLKTNVTDEDDVNDVMVLTKNAGLVKGNIEDSVDDTESPVMGINVLLTSCMTNDCNTLNEEDKAEATVKCGTINPDADNYDELAAELNGTMYNVVGTCCSGLAGCTDYSVDPMVVAAAKRQRRSAGQEVDVFFTFQIYLLPGSDYDSDDISESYGEAVDDVLGDDADGWDTDIVVVIERGAESSTTVSLKASLITLLFAVLPIVIRF